MTLVALFPARGVLSLALVACVLVTGATALADAPTDYLGPRELALGEALRADARGAQATILNPAGLTLSSELVFEGSYSYLSASEGADDDAHAVTASACDSTVPLPGCFYYRYFRRAAADDEGSRLRVHEIGSTLARAFGSLASAGITAKYVDTSGPEGNLSGFAVDVGLLIRASNTIQLAAVGHNLVTLDELQYARAVGAGLVVRPLPALTLAFDARWQLEQEGSTGRYGGGAEYFISTSDRQSGYPLRVGAVHDVAEDATYLTAGLGLMSTSVGFDVGARTRTDGDGFDVLASLRIFGPRVAEGGNRYLQ